MPISNLAVVRWTVLALALGLAALLLIVGVNLWLVGRAAVYADTVNAARQERAAIADLRNVLVDAETGQRGYLLTGSEQYLGPYRDAQQSIASQLARVRALITDDPTQQQSMAKLSELVAEKLTELQNTVAMAEAGQRAEALAEVNTGRGIEVMDQARRLLEAMVARAEAGIDDAVAKQQSSVETLQWVTISGALVIVLVVGGAMWTVLLYTRQLLAAEREVRALNAGLEQRVSERTADLAQANEEIQRFAYIVTHDLRAPLVNIMGFTSELEASLDAIQSQVRRSTETDPDAVAQQARVAALEDLPEAVGFIRSSTRKMDGLINAILKLSREGRRVLKPEPIRLKSLLEASAASVQHQVAESGGEVTIDGNVPTIVSDRLALEQIFGNLLDNAVKYRAPSRPLRVHVRSREDGYRRIVVEVQDNGRGIARQDHERVFDLFRRSGAQDQPGEGIGLAHVRTMVRNLGGDITLDSDLDRGTTIRLNLPRELRITTGAA